MLSHSYFPRVLVTKNIYLQKIHQDSKQGLWLVIFSFWTKTAYLFVEFDLHLYFTSTKT